MMYKIKDYNSQINRILNNTLEDSLNMSIKSLKLILQNLYQKNLKHKINSKNLDLNKDDILNKFADIIIKYFYELKDYKPVYEIIFYMIELGADIKNIDNNPITNLIFKITHYSNSNNFNWFIYKILKYVITKGYCINCVFINNNKESLLSEVIHKYFLLEDDQLIYTIQSVKLLLNNDYLVTDLEENILFYTYDIDILELLLDYGFFINNMSEHGNTPLHSHVLEPNNNFYERIKFLLNKGADPNIFNEDFETSLFTYMKFRHEDSKFFDTVKLMLKYGADPNLLQDEDGYFFTHYMREKSKKWCEKFIDILIKGGLDINIVNSCGRNMGWNADSSMLEVLLERGMNPHQKDCCNQTLLDNIVYNFMNSISQPVDEITERECNDYIKQIDILHNYDISYNHKDFQGNTVMHTACKINLSKNLGLELFIKLFRNGASFNIENSDGEKAVVFLSHLSLFYLLQFGFFSKYSLLLNEILTYIKPHEMEEIQDEFSKFEPSNVLNLKIANYIKMKKKSIIQTLSHKISIDVVTHIICNMVYP